ncbi:MAG: nucleoside deaminase [Planctomycetes bacterium]|nr:nucleoside deaminase [Planctomycetota bacterium]MCK5472620.1 nucleoside deaminase [Planctomycetota bacterium]
MKKTAQEFMMLAIEKAKQAIEKGQTPFGACIVKDEHVISCEHNTVWDTTDITAHAEINAIRKACEKLNTVDLSGCVIYSTCEPCPMCFAACHWARISKIVFGARIKDAKEAGFSELALPNEEMKRLGKSSVEIVADFLSKESIELFKLWSQNSKKRAY